MLNEMQSLDQVLVEQFELDASIGVFEWEKQIKQKLVFDVLLDGDFTAAAASDDIVDAINYVSVCDEITKISLAKHYQLLESLANDIASSLLAKFAIEGLVLTIRKPGAVAKAKSVGVRVSCRRAQVDND